jgi:hypothetical protein
MYVCMYLYFVCMYRSMYVCIFCMYVSMYVCVGYACIQDKICACIHHKAIIYTHTYIHTYIDTYICTYLYASYDKHASSWNTFLSYTYTYIHTYIRMSTHLTVNMHTHLLYYYYTHSHTLTCMHNTLPQTCPHTYIHAHANITTHTTSHNITNLHRLHPHIVSACWWFCVIIYIYICIYIHAHANTTTCIAFILKSPLHVDDFVWLYTRTCKHNYLHRASSNVCAWVILCDYIHERAHITTRIACILKSFLHVGLQDFTRFNRLSECRIESR